MMSLALHSRMFWTKLACCALVPLSLVTAATLEQANELYGEQKYSEAIGAYKSAARQGDNPALCYFNLANAYFQIDSVPRSIVYYQACLNYAPEFFRGYLNLAVAYYTLDDAGNSIATLKRALTLEPENAKANLILAASYGKAGAWKESITLFERILETYPDQEEAYVALGEMYRELDDPDEAIRWLLRYPPDGKNYAYVLSLLADIHEAKGELAGALYYLKKVLAKTPDARWTLYRIISIQQDIGNTFVALQEAREGIRTFPDFGELALLGGNLAFGLEQYGLAEHYYTIAEKLGSPGAIVGLENIRIVRYDAMESK